MLLLRANASCARLAMLVYQTKCQCAVADLRPARSQAAGGTVTRSYARTSNLGAPGTSRFARTRGRARHYGGDPEFVYGLQQNGQRAHSGRLQTNCEPPRA